MMRDKTRPETYDVLIAQAATCYLNTLVQSLFMCPELRCALFNWTYDPKVNKPRAECIPYQLQRMFVQMQTAPQQAPAKKGIKGAAGTAARGNCAGLVASTDLTKSMGFKEGDQYVLML